MTNTSAGAWDEHYVGRAEPFPYGDERSYRRAAHWMQGCSTVEDWGCGGGWLRQFIHPSSTYRGIDGSASPFADEIADLTTYCSDVDGIVLRHVLEHEHQWEKVLDNAVCSFRKHLFIALFTPLSHLTEVLHTEPDYNGVPVIAFRLEDIINRLPTDVDYSIETITSDTVYGFETFIIVTRKQHE